MTAYGADTLRPFTEEVWAPEKRLDIRASRFDANAAFPITPDIWSAHVEAFEEPANEGEVVLEIGTKSL